MGTDDSEGRQVREALQKLEILFAQFSVTVQSLERTVAGMATTMVTGEAHRNLAEKVDRVETDSKQRDEKLQEGIDANSKNWQRLAWAIGLILLGAVATALGLKG